MTLATSTAVKVCRIKVDSHFAYRATNLQIYDTLISFCSCSIERGMITE
jgi:hypothetical protein